MTGPTDIDNTSEAWYTQHDGWMGYNEVKAAMPLHCV